jgi:Protein of unknown function (DUF3043)
VRLLRRRSAEEPPGDGSDNAASPEGTEGPRPARGSARTPHASPGTLGKGRPTPRRAESQRKRTGPVPPPPRTRREAARRQRELGVRGRADSQARVRSGDDSALPRRDRGPERALVRDLVDSRRNASSMFLVVAILVLVSYLIPNQAVKVAVLYLWIGVFALMAGDAILLRGRIRRLMAERLPDSKQRTGGLIWYAANRGFLPRRWRLPRPRVNLGDEI